MKLIICFLLTFSCLAQQIQYIEKGTPAEYSGYLIDSAMEKQMRSKLNTEKAKNVVLSDLNVLKDKRIDFHKEESENAYKELRKQRVKTTAYSIGGFVVGVSLSAIAVYVMKGVIK